MELILTGPEGDTRRRYPLGNGETIVGGRPDCDIVLDAPSIPARHARLFALDGYVVIRTLDSHWPVYVNGEPIDRRPLAHGDEIELGHYRLRFNQQSGAADIDHDAAPSPGKAGVPEATSNPAVEQASADIEAGNGPEPLPDAPRDNAEADSPSLLDSNAETPPNAAPSDPSGPENRPDDDVSAHSVYAGDIAEKTAARVVPDDEHAGKASLAELPIPDVWTDARSQSDASDTRNPFVDAASSAQQGAVGIPEATSSRDTPENTGTANAPDTAEDDEPDDQVADGTEEVNAATGVPPPVFPSPREPDQDGPAAGRADQDTTPQYHLDILSGINAGRRVTLETDRVVLGFNRQRLVEISNDNGRLSLRRADEDSVAHLNGVPISDEPTTGVPGDVVSVQRIELRIGVGGQ